MTWDEALVNRRQDGSVITSSIQEPACIHSEGTQPASACDICKDSTELAEWRAGWAAYIAENPDSTAARAVRKMDERSGDTP